MSSSLSKSLHVSSPLKLIPESENAEKQGIVTILDSDIETTNGKVASLRRTLSADMSSKKWLAQSGLVSSTKKMASSDIESSFSSEEDQEEKLGQKSKELDIWSLILSDDHNASKSLPPPYIHPLLKKSKSSMSQRSLEICTESLGSETGSDHFSSSPPRSEIGDMEELNNEEDKMEEKEEIKTQHVFDCNPVKYRYQTKLAPRSFPPPLPSLSRPKGKYVQMQSRRDNGRLVVEAVSVLSQNNFHARRQDGRLVLSLVKIPFEEELNEEEEEDQFEENLVDFEEDNEVKESEMSDDGEDEEEEEEENEVEEVNHVRTKPILSGGVINIHMLALMMTKPIGLSNKNFIWPNKFNPMAHFEDEEKLKTLEVSPLAQSLPPIRSQMGRPIPSLVRPNPETTSAAASLNTYEYYLLPKPRSQKAAPYLGSIIRTQPSQQSSPMSKGCKEPRQSAQMFQETRCVASS